MNSSVGVEPSISHSVNKVLVTVTADAEQPEIAPSMAPKSAQAVHPETTTSAPTTQSGNESRGRYGARRTVGLLSASLAINALPLQRRSNSSMACPALRPARPAGPARPAALGLCLTDSEKSDSAAAGPSPSLRLGLTTSSLSVHCAEQVNLF